MKERLQQQFVNLYRQVNGSNEGLTTKKLENLKVDYLIRTIDSFQRVLLLNDDIKN